MGLLTEEIEVVLNVKYIKYYEQLGYVIPRYFDKNGRLKVKHGTKIIVKPKDLTNGSNVCLDVQCDHCKIIKNMKWFNYKKYLKEDNKYYCHKCSIKLYGTENMKKTKLKNSKSFEQWCIENNRQDILRRWDYEINDYKPGEICYGTTKKYYFKCPIEIHKSELKNISDFISGHEGSMNCKACNSFAKWGIDNIGEDFLEKYWDYEKNTINPWEINYGSKNKIWIKCQNKEKDYHGSYDVSCNSFTKGSRCPYCTNCQGKVHILDSLGTLYPQVLEIWSDKNKKSPFEYAPKSMQKVWWKCPDGKHKDYKRNANSSERSNFRCPECQYSKGEEIISSYFISNKIIYDRQKQFDGLVGLGNNLLSYDFYLPCYNLLIEYQGQFHDGNGNYYIKQNLKRQREHDKRKREYAKNNNIDLLEIWYWDFDNIEKLIDDKIKEILEQKFAC